jgi:GNAT superfamily N-acetyltransferase
MDRSESSASADTDQIIMRKATESDLDFLAGCYVKIACHMKAGEQDFYIARLPETPDETIRNHVARYVGREDALTLLEETEGSPVACLLASIGSSSFSASRVGKSGHIAVCWVEPANRRSGIAAKLVSAAEDWFRQKESVSSSFRIWSKTNSPRFHGSDSAINHSDFSYKEL